jgi:hypothetical protein
MGEARAGGRGGVDSVGMEHSACPSCSHITLAQGRPDRVASESRDSSELVNLSCRRHLSYGT